MEAGWWRELLPRQGPDRQDGDSQNLCTWRIAAVQERVTNGMKHDASGTSSAPGGTGPKRLASDWEAGDRATAVAWERFVTGDEAGPGVRPEILRSWYRCRDEYKIDPSHSHAPPADDYWDHSLKNDRVVAELSGVGMALVGEVEALGGLVAITDGAGRVLTAWGDRRALHQGEQSNLAPWFAWSERTTGTNGMGTALTDPKGVLVRRYEHWFESLHDWTCAGTAIRDPATGQPLAVLDVSSWRKPLPNDILPWLRKAVHGVEAELRKQAKREAFELEAVFKKRDRIDQRALIVLDNGGGIVAANARAESLVGAPASRFVIDHPELASFIRQGAARARIDRSWVGFAELFIPHFGDILPFTIRPVIIDNRMIGLLGILDESEGEDLSNPGQSAEPSCRVAATQANRLILLRPEEIRFAEAERNTVWLVTRDGRLRAKERGLERLEEQLRDEGFLRVHRHCVVNLSYVREIKYGFRGQLSLATGARSDEIVPVSRRRAAAVRKALHL